MVCLLEERDVARGPEDRTALAGIAPAQVTVTTHGALDGAPADVRVDDRRHLLTHERR